MPELSKEDLFEGVQIPSNDTKPISKDVKKIVVKPILSDKEMEENLSTI